MSTGSIIGGFVGAIVGFYAGGPYGAFVGAAVGAGVGAVVDPISYDVAKPDTVELSSPVAEEGTAIARCFGTVPISSAATYMWYANPHTAEQTDDSGGKGGGGSDVVSGYKYYLSFAIGICKGPVDTLFSIWENNNILWPADGSSPLTIDDATNGKVTITIAERGTIDFYFGTDSQAVNSLMASYTGYSIPYRGLCYVVFNDFMIGEYNRVGALKFIVRRVPEHDISLFGEIGDYDYNPIHFVYDVLVDRLNLDTDYINLTQLAADAETLDGEDNTESNSGRGISMLCKTKDSTILDYLESVFFHIRGCLRFSNEGQFETRLFRKDVETANMLSIDENDILEEIDVSREDVVDLDNQISSTFTQIKE